MIDQTRDQVSSHSVQDEQFQLLRSLLVLPEQERLAQIEEWVRDATLDEESLGKLLPKAIFFAAQDDALAQALGPTLSQAFSQSVKDDPQSLADAVAPIMGPAIRQSIQQAIQSMVQSLNQALDQSLSAKGISWRIESWRTGRPFSEVVMLNSLKYRVEEVFLIHQETSLLLQHVSSEKSENADADLVSSMLSAIQDFVRDSFGGRADDTLRTMQVGDKTVWVQQGSQAIVAAAIQGNAPESLRVDLTETLERIHVEHGHALDGFEGDSAKFEVIKPVLQNCLKSEQKEAEAEPTKPKRNWPAMALGMALLVLIGFGIRSGHRVAHQSHVRSVMNVPHGVDIQFDGPMVTLQGTAQRSWLSPAKARADSLRVPITWDVVDLDREWFDALQQLQQEPGLVVVHSAVQPDAYYVEGMRDPLAIEPDAIVAAKSLRLPVKQTWKPVMSAEPELVVERFRRTSQCPSSVSLELYDGVLSVAGSAKREWIDGLKSLPLTVPIERLDLSGLKESDANVIAFIEAIRTQPGYVVAGSGFDNGKLVLTGLRDPLAVAADELAKEYGLDPATLQTEWESYQSSDSAIVLLRARNVLNPPDSIEFELNDGLALQVTGAAGHVWLNESKDKQVPGVKTIDWGLVVDSDHQRWDSLIAKIKETSIPFTSGSSELNPTQDAMVKTVARDLDQLAATAKVLGRRWSLDIKGHSAKVAFASNQLQMSLDRAKTVEKRLGELMKAKCTTDVVGVGSWEEHASPSQMQSNSNGSVSFRFKWIR